MSIWTNILTPLLNTLNQIMGESCQHCEQVKRLLRECESNLAHALTANTDNIERVEKEKKQLNQTVQELNLMIQELNQRLNSVMADKMNKSGALENTNEEYSNTNLAQRFDTTVKQLWIDVNEDIEKEYNEVDRLSMLSHMCKTVFTAFHMEVENANKRILDGIFSEENTLTDSILTDIRIARKENSGKRTTRENQEKKILDTIKWPEDIKRIIYECTETRIKTFLTELADVCWLMVTSNPPLILNFDAEGKTYTACIREKFVEYGTSEDISHANCEPGHVLLVAWPSVELEDNKGYLTKGEVVVMPNKTNN